MSNLVGSTRGRSLRLLLTMLTVMITGFGAAWSTISTDYIFQYGTGTGYDMTGAAAVPTTSDDDGSQTAAPYDIGFNFVFNGTTYTQFSLNSNGLIKLGGAPVVSGTRFNEDFPSFGPTPSDMPFIAPFWDDLYSHGDKIRYKLTGTAPNRVLVIEYHTEKYSFNNLEDLRMQVRLYETSNKIEFCYITFTTQAGFNVFNGFIGIAQSTSDYGRVVPGAPPQFLTTGSGTVTPPAAGTLYTFLPCQTNVIVAGNVAQGGTAAMASGDTLLAGTTVMRGNNVTLQPFSIGMGPYACASRDYTVTVGGANAADYQVSPAGGTLAANQGQPVSVTFTPGGVGVRYATVTVADNNGYSRTFNLAASGQTRISYSGNVAQGGTVSMNDGDALLTGFSVYNGNSVNYTPLTVTNINPSGTQPAAPVAYSIVGTSGGQYTISPSSASLAANQSSTPVITFTPNSGGVITDTLVVTADGNEVRRFVLAATGISPEARYERNTFLMDSTSVLFNSDVPCVGVQMATYEVRVINTGFGDLHITGSEVYATDTAFGQGIPGYPLLRDAQGRAIPLVDYVMTTFPPSMPIQSNQQTYPIVVAAGDTQKLYFSFVGQRPNKRFARIYIHSDAVNFRTADTGGVARRGLMRFDLFGRAVSGRLTENPDGIRPRTVTFPNTHVFDSSMSKMVIFNQGQCDLRISLPSISITAGDADEFSIVRLPSSSVDPVTNDVVIPPGTSDTLWLRFKPLQEGSRRAGLRLATNDSTVLIPGVTERGVYYIDLFGNGKADLYANDVDFGMALIGGGPADQIRRSVRLKNTLNGTVVITKIFWEGADTAEIKRDPATPWPGTPLFLNSSVELDLGVIFAPLAGGQPGPRHATLKLITLSGDTIVSQLGGIAGTRTIAVSPGTLNFGNVTVGKLARRKLMVSNTGTMPLTLGQPVMSPGSDFNSTLFPRLVLVPGQVEFVEVTYAPQAAGGSTATLLIPSNASGGAVQVNLNGSAVRTKLGDPDPSQSATTGNGDANASGIFDAIDGLSLSGVESVDGEAGMSLLQSVPNPASERAEIIYHLSKGGDVRLELYDATGHLVRLLDAGHRGVGEQRVTVDVRDLASGIYHYRLVSGGRSLTGAMSVVR